VKDWTHFARRRGFRGAQLTKWIEPTPSIRKPDAHDSALSGN
jgi:hypothetical protein